MLNLTYLTLEWIRKLLFSFLQLAWQNQWWRLTAGTEASGTSNMKLVVQITSVMTMYKVDLVF